jgi:hypothetical protein
MAQCFEMLVSEAFSSKSSDDAELSEPVSIVFALLPEAEQALDAALAVFDMTAATFLMRLGNARKQLPSLPWAVIMFDHHYRLAGHFCGIRPDRRLLGGPHELPPGFSPDRDVAAISNIIALDKPALRQAAATGSPMLESAWSALADKPGRSHWLCIADPLPKDWVAENEANDDALYRSLRE